MNTSAYKMEDVPPPLYEEKSISRKTLYVAHLLFPCDSISNDKHDQKSPIHMNRTYIQ